MYLKDLNFEERQAYIKLALLLISADDQISKRELNMLELQNKEMGDYELPSFDDLQYIDINKLLKGSSNETFRKIYFELLLIAHSDNFGTKEDDLLEKVYKIIDITPEERENFITCAKAISDTYYVLDKLVTKGIQ